MASMTARYGAFCKNVQRGLFCLAVAGVVAIAGRAGPAQAAEEKPLKIVAFGDSLTAGYGLPAADAFPTRLAEALRAKGVTITIVNAGVSGDTTSGGKERLDWSIPDDANGVILELGANDALRGVDPKVTEAALDAILTRLAARKIPVLICGMLAPPNYGGDYAARFNAIFPALAKKHNAQLYPFFLDGVAADAALNQADGIHPNAKGVKVIVSNILPKVEAFIAQLRASGGS